MNLLETIKTEYELCIDNPKGFADKVELISTMLGLRGKNKLISETCPVYIVGKYEITPFIFFGINPGHSDINSPKEDKVARSSWEGYQTHYQNFFSYFDEQGFESPYYTILRYFMDGLVSTFGGTPIENKWKLFEKYITNIELIPYHSRGISLPTVLRENQFRYLHERFSESVEFISQYDPRLFIFNGSPWHNLLIKNNIITKFEKFNLTENFNLYFFKINNIPSVLFDKFFQRHFWGITNQDRRTTIPQLIAKKYPSISLSSI